MTEGSAISKSDHQAFRMKRRRRKNENDGSICAYNQGNGSKEVSLRTPLVLERCSTFEKFRSQALIAAVVLLCSCGFALGYAPTCHRIKKAQIHCHSRSSCCYSNSKRPPLKQSTKSIRPNVRVTTLSARHGRYRYEERREYMYDDPNNTRGNRQGESDNWEDPLSPQQFDNDGYSNGADPTEETRVYESTDRVRSPQRLNIRIPVDDLSSSKGGPLQRGKQMSRAQQYSEEEEDDDYYYDDNDEYFDFEQDSRRKGGNYWSNPVSGPEKPRGRRRTRQRPTRRSNNVNYEDYIDERGELGEKYRSTRTFRNNIGDFPEPPGILSNLYNNLFWYGFDPAEGNPPDGEATMFGGTRGKFNGLAFLREAEKGFQNNERPYSSNGRSRSARRLNEDPLAFLDDNNDFNSDEYDFENDQKRKRRTNSRDFPPTRRRDENLWYDENGEDRDEIRRQRIDSKQPRRRRQGRDLDDDDYDIPYRRQRQVSPEYSSYENNKGFAFGLTSLLEAFIGMDEDQRDLLAREYDLKMGIASRANKDARPIQRDLKSKYRDDPDVLEMEYAYDNDYLDVEANTIEADTNKYSRDIPSKQEKNEEEKLSPKRERSTSNDKRRDNKNDPQTIVDRIFERKQKETEEANGYAAERNEKSRPRFEKDISWEKRDEAFDRIPPEGIEGWGPNGTLPKGVDARKQAAIDAKKEIQEAEQIVEELRTIAQEVGQDLKSLRAEAKGIRRELARGAARRRVMIGNLQQIEEDIECVTDELFDVKDDLDGAILLVEELRERHEVLLSQVSAEEYFQNASEDKLKTETNSNKK